MTIRLTEKTLETLATERERVGKPQLVAWDADERGLGVVIGKKGATFVVESRVDGEKVRTKIGIAGRVRDDGHVWSVKLARIEARKKLGEMASGVNPNAEKRAHRDGITLREGLDLHVADMRKRDCSPRSIETIEAEIPKYLSKWIDEPIASIEALELHEVHSSLTKQGKKYLANRLIAEVSAVWNSVDRLHELPGRNPATRVRRNKLAPKRERIDDAELPTWRAKVETLPPVRRDLQLLIIHTGLRSADARAIRWADLDLAKRTLHRPSPKGGVAKAFTAPLPGVIVEMLRTRKRENAKKGRASEGHFGDFGGDGGFVFPSLSRARGDDGKFVVQPIAEAKEYKQTGGRKGAKERFLVGPHVLRRTFISIGREIGIPEIDMHALANHSFSTGRVQDQYVRQAIDHLLACSERIASALASRFKA